MNLNLEKPILMGILNITPDSFSDGGKFFDQKKALDRVAELKQEGADIIDIGAQSTAGPEAMIKASEEWRRLEPVLTAIDYSKIFVSVDTFRSDVAKKSLDLGVQMINDVTGLRGDPKMIDALCHYQPYICLMHSSYDTPYAGNEERRFADIMTVIKRFLKQKTDLLIKKGFPSKKIIIDPGLGRFLSNDPEISFEVIDRLSEFKTLGFPILIGPSRKSFLGGAMKDRDKKTAKICLKAIKNGANILRVHNIKYLRNLIH